MHSAARTRRQVDSVGPQLTDSTILILKDHVVKGSDLQWRGPGPNQFFTGLAFGLLIEAVVATLIVLCVM